jgi:hypothetical protein
VGETFYSHTPGISEVEFAAVGLTSLLVVRGYVDIVAFVFDDSSVVGSGCTEGTFADSLQHLFLLTPSIFVLS